MRWTCLVWLALLISRGHASPSFATSPMLRFSCSQLVVERLDPLVNPGLVPSPHLHPIVGGNSFNVTMDPSNDMPNLSTCTMSEDFSNYWIAVFGLTVYYIPPYDGHTNVTAFEQGFRMLVGDPMLRKDTNTSESRSMSYRCFEKNWGQIDIYPGGGNDTRDFPNVPCPGGIRVNNFFPTCWDGKNLDSADHKGHVSYPESGVFEMNGPCPSMHPVKIPQVMYETVWNTMEFNDKSLWPTDGSQPFEWSMKDPVGTPGDYVFGWKGDALQRAMDNFCHVDCPVLKNQTYEEANKCSKAPVVNEPIDGCK